MKIKFIPALMFVLCLAISALAQTGARKDNKTVKPEANAAKTDSMDSVLMDKERAVWKAIQAKQYDEFGKLLADDYRGVSADQVYDKTRALIEIKQANFSKTAVSYIQIVWADKNTAVVTAIVDAEVLLPDSTTETSKTRTTSVWTKRGNNWLVVYHTDSAM